VSTKNSLNYPQAPNIVALFLKTQRIDLKRRTLNAEPATVFSKPYEESGQKIQAAVLVLASIFIDGGVL
jgi:hypothetical protein